MELGLKLGHFPISDPAITKDLDQQTAASGKPKGLKLKEIRQPQATAF